MMSTLSVRSPSARNCAFGGAHFTPTHSAMIAIPVSYLKPKVNFGTLRHREACGRSPIEVCVRVIEQGTKILTISSIWLKQTFLDPMRFGQLRAKREYLRNNRPFVPPATRRTDVQFVLTIVAPLEAEAAVTNVLRAWILFGGYGGRTRRGLGSLTVESDLSVWLPDTEVKAPNGVSFLSVNSRASVEHAVFRQCS